MNWYKKFWDNIERMQHAASGFSKEHIKKNFSEEVINAAEKTAERLNKERR